MVSDRVKYSLLGDTHNDDGLIIFKAKMISGDEKTPV